MISQSGETADTLNALKLAKEHGPTLALVNVEASTIARLADASIPLRAGPERGVASTKAFCAQLMSMAALSVVAGRQRGVLDEDNEERLTAAFERLPAVLARTLELEGSLVPIAKSIGERPSAMYLGRGAFHALSLEGAL
ncbi:MAG: glucosamine--fructose-6-phosphate aminotransferase (isomerizing), partial [Polyangiales bacterium]